MRDRLLAVLLGLLAAGPSLLWAARDPAFISDDFAVSGRLHAEGWRYLVELSFEQPARPLAGPYYALIYLGIGDRPVIHALVLAAANVALVLAGWRLARAVVRPRTADLAALVLAVVPNRGASRLWFVVGNYPLATAGVLVGLLLLVRRRIAWPAAPLLVASILLYEGVAGLAGVGVVLWWAAAPRPRLRPALVTGAAMAAAAATLFLLSPKRSTTEYLADVGTFAGGQWGLGLWRVEPVGTIVALAVLGAVGVALVRRLPSFRRDDPVHREILLGAAVTAGAAAPFWLSGSSFAVAGIFDRNNLVPAVGTALLLGAIGHAALVRLPAPAGTAVVAVALAWLAVWNVEDVEDYREAAAIGRQMVAGLERGLDPEGRVVLVGPPLDEVTGVAQHIYPADLSFHLERRNGPAWSGVVIPLDAGQCVDLAREAAGRGEEVVYFDRRTNVAHTDGVVDRCRRAAATD